ncbi:MAG: outer membrane beta-barrel protein [bacterium]
MKKELVFVMLTMISLCSFAQQDTSSKKTRIDTIKVGGMTILKSVEDRRVEIKAADTLKSTMDTIKVGSIVIAGKGLSQSIDRVIQTLESLKNENINKLDELTKKKIKKVSTNWMVFDIGFSGYSDRTNYSSSSAQNFLQNQAGIPASKGDYALRGSRISNFNLWFFMQRLSIASGVLNLKYGLGIESNNYFFKSGITYVDGISPYTIRSTSSMSKNKLVANYLTVPLMLNVNTNPKKPEKGLQFSAGISGGYLYSSRQKQISDAGKNKVKTDFNLERFKVSYVGEIGLGPVKLYTSIAMKPMHQFGLDQQPYTVGVRFSN